MAIIEYSETNNLPVVIIGAGISGLLLAQKLRKDGIPFRIFERDDDFSTRGVGWGLTLHWSLPALRHLLPEHLVQRLPEAYVDRQAVEQGAASGFPFYDLSTGELKFTSPKAPEFQRIRVTREKLRKLLATDIDIEWNQRLQHISYDSESVVAHFENGGAESARLVVACDGAQSQVRRELFPDRCETHPIPIRMLGVKLALTPQAMKPILDLDPFFLQGSSSKDDSFVYISLLDAPGNSAESSDKYVCQMCMSWPYRAGFLGNEAPVEIPETNEERHALIQKIGANWADPFGTFVRNISSDEVLKDLIPQDYPPPLDLRSRTKAVLMGDAVHAMAMFRGEGANHAIEDVFDFAEHVVPHLGKVVDTELLDAGLEKYQAAVVQRTRPGVLASRRACLDAHEWERIISTSPLITKRDKFTNFTEE